MVTLKQRALAERERRRRRREREREGQVTEAQSYYTTGEQFIEAVKSFGCNENGDPIRLRPWFIEYLKWLGELRIPKKAISGAQQSGKSLGCTLFLAYAVQELGLKMIYSYDSQAARNSQVTLNLRPILNAWEEAKELNGNNLDRNTEIWKSLSGGFAKYVYSSVNRNVGQRKGLAAAGGVNVGFQADGLIDEERSQSPPGARDAFYRRLAESKLKPYPPHINLGTPGGGLGIELDFQQYDHHFYPFYKCPECGAVKPLHPKGCLLKPVTLFERGEEIQRWFSPSGKPLEWWHSDPDKIESSAYIGCSECGAKLPDEVRIGAWFQGVRFNIKFDIESVKDITLSQFLQGLPDGEPKEQISSALIISPLLRDSDTAATMIRQLLGSKDIADAHQQVLGIPSEAGSGVITEEMIQRCIELPIPEREPDCVVAGGDQGVNQDWLWVARCWLPSGYGQMLSSEIADKTVMEVVFYGPIQRSEVGAIIQKYNIDAIAYDSKPEVADGIALARNHGVFLGKQMSLPEYDIRSENKIHDGENYCLYSFRQEDFQDQVAASFDLIALDGYPLWRLPESFHKWLQLRNDERSPVRHLCAMQKDGELGKWVRPDDHVDDQFFAAMFLKLAFRLWLDEKNTSVFVVGRAKW